MQSRLPLRAALPAALAAVLALLLAAPVAAQPKNDRAIQNHTVQIALMATTDVHGRVLSWDYLKDEAYSPGRGLARISSLVDEVREEHGAEQTLLFDIGDMIQGTPLAAYYARQEPITDGAVHPIATAMNAMGYDAMVVGNHEFNFGLDTLYAFRDQLEAPMLGGNVLFAGTDQPAFRPYVMETIKIRGDKPIRVGVVGITNPGVAVWDRTNVEGQLDIVDGLETARRYVTEVRRAGADIVVVAVHSGMGSGSSYGDLIPYPENFGTEIAEEVPGVDVVFPGHSHETISEEFVTNDETGAQVLVSQPASEGRYLSVAELDLQKIRGQWDVTSKASELLDADSVTDDPTIVGLVESQHETVVDYVNAPIGTSLVALPMAEADYKDVPALDLINEVQAEAVDAGLAGTPYADYPVLSATAPLSRSAVIPAGDVSIRDIAAVYVYPNSLRGIVMTGEDLEDYLEHSAEYFKPVSSSGPFTSADVIGNGGIRSYCYDVIQGLSYDIDLGEPLGQRIENLSFEGAPVALDDEFVMAINNYRNDGGCGYPHVTTAPIAYFENPDIQDLLIQWIQAAGTIDPATFASVDWQLTYGGTPIAVTP